MGVKVTLHFRHQNQPTTFSQNPLHTRQKLAPLATKPKPPAPRRLDQTVSKYTKIFVPTLTTARAKKLRRQWSTR